MIYFFGDVHGCFDHVLDLVKERRPKAIVFLGDIQAQRPLDVELASILDVTQIWFVHGNHDTDSDLDFDNLFGSKLADRNLHGRIVDIDGQRVAGLGGIFRGQIWLPPGGFVYEKPVDFVSRSGKGNVWRGGLPRKHRSSIFPCDYLSLANQRADILVTHEAPGAHPYGFTAIDDLARGLRVTKSFHGHHHDRLDYSAQWPRLGFNAYGVGFCGVTDADGNVVSPGEFDQARTHRQSQVM